MVSEALGGSYELNKECKENKVRCTFLALLAHSNYASLITIEVIFPWDIFFFFMQH
jgi:hypothetical protein